MCFTLNNIATTVRNHNVIPLWIDTEIITIPSLRIPDDFDSDLEIESFNNDFASIEFPYWETIF